MADHGIRGLANDLLARLLADAKPIPLQNGSTGFVIPHGYELVRVPPLLEPLTIIKSNPVFHDVDSFITYVNEFKTEGHTRLFAESGSLSAHGEGIVRAIIDYHRPTQAVAPDGDAVAVKKPAPDYCRHIAVFAPRYSVEWKRWVSEPLENVTQVVFAEFIEENRSDIREPDAASLLDLIRAFKVTRKKNFDSVLNLANGTVRINASDEVEGNGGVDVPTTLKLGIPVYFNGPLYELSIFMRYRNPGPTVCFTLKPDRAEYVERAAFQAILQRIEKETNLKPHLGRVLE